MYVHVGKIHSAQGIRGDVFIYIFAGEAAWSDQWKTLYLGPKDAKEPNQEIKINHLRFHQKQKKPGFVLKLDGITDRNKADELIGLQVFIPEDFLVSVEGEEIYLREVLGFEVVDKERGLVGTVEGFSGNSMQDLLVVKDEQGRSFEVPFVEPILIEIQKAEKKLQMDIPQGLVAGEEL